MPVAFSAELLPRTPTPVSGGHPPASRFSHSVAASQTLDQLALEFPNGDDVNVAVNRLVGGVYRGQLRVFVFEHACDFLRRPALPEPRVNFVAKRRTCSDIAPAALAGAPPRQRSCVRPGCAVSSPAAVAFDLRADRPRRAIQSQSQRRSGVPRPQSRLNFNPSNQGVW